MIAELPFYISFVFILTTLLTVLLFSKTIHHSIPILLLVLLWLIVQGIVGLNYFYIKTDNMPPRFVLLVLPPLVLILLTFLFKAGRNFIDKIDLKTSTYLHVVRIPVELVLLWLFMYGKIPQLMTFEGRNFDVISGLTAPFIAYYGFTKKILNKNIILAWNFICLGLLLNIVINAVLSAPFPFQKFAFEQPNIGLLFFPFVWLPAFIVPVVLFCHLVSIRNLMKQKQ